MEGGELEVVVFGEIQVSCCVLSNIHIFIHCSFVKAQAEEPVVLRWPEEILARMGRALKEAVAERLRLVQVWFPTLYSRSSRVIFVEMSYLGTVINSCL